MPNFSFWVFATLDFTQKKQRFFGSRHSCAHLGDINSSEQGQIELKFWPQVDFMVVQIQLKRFEKLEFLQR